MDTLKLWHGELDGRSMRFITRLIIGEPAKMVTDMFGITLRRPGSPIVIMSAMMFIELATQLIIR
jgi:hypothetical protein